jgi:hypothetical protein
LVVRVVVVLAGILYHFPEDGSDAGILLTLGRVVA